MIIILYVAVVAAIILLALWFSFRDTDHHKHPAWNRLTTLESLRLTKPKTLLLCRFWHLPDNMFLSHFLCLFWSCGHPFHSCKFNHRCWTIETPRSKADEESDSVKVFLSVLFANPVAELTGNLPDFVIQAGALTGIQKKSNPFWSESN